MKINYNAKSTVYFSLLVCLFVMASVWLWSLKEASFTQESKQLNDTLTALVSLSTINNKLNYMTQKWPSNFNQEDEAVFETQLKTMKEVLNDNEAKLANLNKAINKNIEYWSLVKDYSSTLNTLELQATSLLYIAINSPLKPSQSVVTAITRLPEQHWTFLDSHSLIAFAAIKRDVSLLKEVAPEQQEQLDRYLQKTESILSETSLRTGMLSKLQAVRFEREYDLNYHLKTLITQYKTSISQLHFKQDNHLYLLYGLFAFFILVLLFKIYNLVKSIEIYRQKSIEVKRYADRKVQQYKSAEQAKSNFLMVISYEARTALDVIIGLTKFVSEQKINNLQKAKLAQVSSTSKSLNHLLNDVLELIDLDMRTVELENEVFSVKDVLGVLGEKYQALAQENHLLYEEEIDNQLTGNFVGDQARFYQLMDYLLSNAFKNTEKGHVSLSVTLDTGRGLSAQYQRINFQIEDTGLKPSANEVATLFESFSMTKFQASRKSGGEGVRLGIINALVQLMKGEIEASHSGSSGMKYNLFLYLEKSNSGEEAVPVDSLKASLDKTAEPSEKLVEVPSLNILVVEDSSVNAFLLKWILEGFKHTVTIAKNGIECLNLLDSADFDLIFMDQYMPEMNGAEATEKIRGLNNDKAEVPIIGCTADAFQETRNSLLEAGQNDIIIKPITNTVVADVINKYIQGDYKVVAASEVDENAEQED